MRHLQVDLIAAGDVELYAREDDLPSLIAEYSLIPSQLPNVIMRVPPAELWLFDDVEAPWPVVAVDLLDARDDRSVRAANDLARRAGNPMIPIVPIEPLVLPRLGPHHVGLWTTLCDLADAHDSDRVVIGSQMVVLHALQARREPGRVSQDVDTVIDARIRPPALPAFLATLAELGFESAGVRPDEVAHRFKRATVHVDVLGPDGLGARADLRTTGTATTIQVRGGTQALRRSERVPVRHADRVALVPSRTCLAPS